jgi:hypothetical protein
MSTASPRADFVASIVWIAFGVAIVAGSLKMDRLERFGATFYTAPGLVPGVLGGMIALLGAILLVRSLRRGAVATFGEPWSLSAEGRTTLWRATIATALSLVYTLLLVGRGLPFWAVTVAFVFTFMLVFYVPECRARGQARRGVAMAVIVAIVTSATVTLVFERIFLVRLP